MNGKYKVILLIVFILLGLTLLEVSDRDLKYPGGKDTVYSFGDGSFSVSSNRSSLEDLVGRYTLFGHCNDIATTIIHEVEKYIDMFDGRVYIIGYYSDGGTFDENDNEYPSIFHTNTQTCSYEKYDSVDQIPKYLILNYNTGELTTYLTWDDVPESDKVIFSQDLDWWCQFRNTCYEKEGADLY